MLSRASAVATDVPWARALEALWSDKHARTTFEKEMNWSPLICDSALFEDYQAEYIVWSIRHLGLENQVPVYFIDRSPAVHFFN